MVPETLEPSLQLASAVLSQLNMPSDEVAQAIQNFRKNHVSELQVALYFDPVLLAMRCSTCSPYLTVKSWCAWCESNESSSVSIACIFFAGDGAEHPLSEM